jgi:hypothetical protein
MNVSPPDTTYSYLRGPQYLLTMGYRSGAQQALRETPAGDSNLFRKQFPSGTDFYCVFH